VTVPFLEADAFRLEPVPVDLSLADGLEAGVADPLWLLARQWQFGELAGEDAGSPAAASMWVETSPLTRFSPQAPSGGATAIDMAAVPLEARVEAEPERGNRLAALAGLHYLRLLAEIPDGAELSAYVAGLLGRYPLSDVDVGGRDPFLALAPGRVPEGRALAAELETYVVHDDLPPEPSPGTDDVRAHILAAARSFLGYFRTLTGEVVETESSWLPERLEYRASIAAPRENQTEVVLTATEYDGGALDWFSFDVAPGATLGAKGDTGWQVNKLTFMPAPVTYRGMPSARFWEFEDSRVHFGGIEANAEDIAAMVVVEFAARFGNDYFLVPLPLDIGSVARVDGLVVVDTFGQPLLVPAASEQDAHFRLFEHSSPDGSRERSLVLFPAVVGVLESEPLEDVALLRDEAANICWAVERTVVDAAGLTVDRGSEAAQARAAQPPPAAAPDPDGLVTLSYEPRSATPPNWYPLLPVEARLRLGVMPALPGVPDQPAPSGRVLDELTDVLVPAEEVTRDGCIVVRTFQYARGAYGAQVLWAGRRVRAGGEARPPDLQFDQATLPRPTVPASARSREAEPSA
jgi:hypothetical protein